MKSHIEQYMAGCSAENPFTGKIVRFPDPGREKCNFSQIQAKLAAAAEKYTEKGKDIMAKVGLASISYI